MSIEAIAFNTCSAKPNFFGVRVSQAPAQRVLQYHINIGMENPHIERTSGVSLLYENSRRASIRVFPT
jgi:hypothetical protein